MKIHVNDKFFIDDDGRNYTIKERTGKVNKNDQEIVTTHRYCSTIENALKEISRLMVVTEEEEMTIGEYVDSLNENFKALKDAVQKGQKNEQ